MPISFRHIVLFALCAAALLVPSANSAGVAVVPASVFVSPGGSDSAPCTRGAPCRSFDRAYRAARAGQVVEVAGGEYSGQRIERDERKSSPKDVIFRPARGASVRVGSIDVYGSHLELRKMVVGGWYAKPGADDVTFRNLVVRGSIFITSATNIAVIGGEVGPGKNHDSQIKSDGAGATPPTNILIHGVNFHDWTRDGDEHVECLQFGAGVNVTIRNSRFKNCATHDVFVRSWGKGYPLRNWVVENNVFDRAPDGYYSFKVNGNLNPSDCGGFVVRYNSAVQSMHAQDCRGGLTWIGNVAPSQTCYGTFAYNVWYGSRGGRCGNSDRTVRDPRFVDARKLDLRLGVGSPAIDRGDPSRFPIRDIRGKRRPAGRAPDAGAYEGR